MNSAIRRAFQLLLDLRQYSGAHSAVNYFAAQGFIDGLFWSDVLTSDQHKTLGELACSAFLNICAPFPPKYQAPVAAHESDKQVPAPTARAELPVQRVLVSPFHVLRTLFGKPISRSIRPSFSRLHPSWAPVSAGWPVAVSGSQMRLSLGTTQTTCPVLEHYLQLKKRALRADLRAIRLMGAC